MRNVKENFFYLTKISITYGIKHSLLMFAYKGQSHILSFSEIIFHWPVTEMIFGCHIFLKSVAHKPVLSQNTV